MPNFLTGIAETGGVASSLVYGVREVLGDTDELSSLQVGCWMLWVCAPFPTWTKEIFAALPRSLSLVTLIAPFSGSLCSSYGHPF